MELRLTSEALARLLASPSAVGDLAAEPGTLVVVDDLGRGPTPFAVPELLPAVVVRGDGLDAAVDALGADLVAEHGSLDAVVETVARHPQAAAALAVLVRGSERRSVAEGLHAESAVYGVLQGGEEFGRWRVDKVVRGRAAPPTTGPLRATREGDELRIVLTRPEVRNALDRAMRDALAEALSVALEDPSVQVDLRGDGPCFCAGGDLGEFGTFADPASAHLVRLARNLGWTMAQLSARTHVHAHGPSRGSGVELAVFAGRLTADPEATFGLPEVHMGLIPGSGGTVSIPRRIGRARTMWLALTTHAIDADTARAWGLVDRIAPA